MKTCELLSQLISNILFDIGKSTIRPESINIIVNVTKIMNEQIPNSGFYIDGYTDNVEAVNALLLWSKKSTGFFLKIFSESGQKIYNIHSSYNIEIYFKNQISLSEIKTCNGIN